MQPETISKMLMNQMLLCFGAGSVALALGYMQCKYVTYLEKNICLLFNILPLFSFPWHSKNLSYIVQSINIIWTWYYWVSPKVKYYSFDMLPALHCRRQMASNELLDSAHMFVDAVHIQIHVPYLRHSLVLLHFCKVVII